MDPKINKTSTGSVQFVISDNSGCLLSTCYMPGAVLNTFYGFILLHSHNKPCELLLLNPPDKKACPRLRDFSATE